jgi:hypothetical protein
MKSCDFCDIIPCSPVKVNRSFGGRCRLHIQDRRISQARYQHDFQRTTRGYISKDRTFLSLYLFTEYIPWLLWSATTHYRSHSSPQLNPIHTLTTSVFKLHFNIILQSTNMSPNWSLHFRFSNRNFSSLSIVLHTPPTSSYRVLGSSKTRIGGSNPAQRRDICSRSSVLCCPV